MSNITSAIDELKIIYQEIIDGCSISSDGKVFFRHLTELDYIEVLRYRMVSFKRYVKEGLPSEQERLKTLFETEEWNQDKEDRITSLRLTISDNEKNLSKFVIAQQQAGIRKAISNDKEELLALLVDRHNMMGMTADELSNKESNMFTLYLSLYSDRACKVPLFKTFNEFESSEGQESDRLAEDMDTCLQKFSELKIRQVSIMPFFLNNFSYSKDNIHSFLQKPTVSFTSYQTLLFSLGQRNLNILSQSQGSPPEMYSDVSPNDVLTWYDQQYSVILGKRNAAK